MPMDDIAVGDLVAYGEDLGELGIITDVPRPHHAKTTSARYARVWVRNLDGRSRERSFSPKNIRLVLARFEYLMFWELCCSSTDDEVVIALGPTDVTF
jgi:hypothetical protein